VADATSPVQVPYVFLSGTALLGGPALPPAEFAKYRQRRNLGVSLAVAAPTGEYKSSQLVKLGANRWSLKPEVGYSVPNFAFPTEIETKACRPSSLVSTDPR
jgi:hypothetical protein